MSNESIAGSAYFHKLTTAKTTCTHNVFGNEENFRKITSLQTSFVDVHCMTLYNYDKLAYFNCYQKVMTFKVVRKILDTASCQYR